MSSPNSVPGQRDLATLFFRNRHLLVLAIAIILVAGLSALLNLPRIEDPRITNRNPTILTLLPGASAARVGESVFKPVARAPMSADNFETSVRTTCSAGSEGSSRKDVHPDLSL